MALWVVILVMILMLVTMLRQGQTTPPELTYNEFVAKVANDEVGEITIEEGHVHGAFKEGGGEFSTYIPPSVLSEELLERWRAKGGAAQARGGLPAPGPDDVVPAARDHRPLGVLHPPDAGRWRQGHELRQVARAAADREPAARDLRGRGRRRGVEGRARGDHRLPAR